MGENNKKEKELELGVGGSQLRLFAANEQQGNERHSQEASDGSGRGS